MRVGRCEKSRSPTTHRTFLRGSFGPKLYTVHLKRSQTITAWNKHVTWTERTTQKFSHEIDSKHQGLVLGRPPDTKTQSTRGRLYFDFIWVPKELQVTLTQQYVSFALTKNIFCDHLFRNSRHFRDQFFKENYSSTGGTFMRLLRNIF